jgi:hypothetical protein
VLKALPVPLVAPRVLAVRIVGAEGSKERTEFARLSGADSCGKVGDVVNGS